MTFPRDTTATTDAAPDRILTDRSVTNSLPKDDFNRSDNGIAESNGRDGDIAERASALLRVCAGDPAGMISPSIYETGRIVSLAPWLPGQDERLAFLVAEQHPDGSWGGPGGYAVVPTLSATEALLRVLHRDDVPNPTSRRFAAAAANGLGALETMLRPDAPPFADMIAAELIVPALIAELNEWLAISTDTWPDALLGWVGAKFDQPAEADSGLLDRLRANPAAAGAKLSHTLEIFGDAARGLPGVQPISGNLGCSPASTAAWLGTKPPDGEQEPVMAYLLDAIKRSGGAVPGVTPITTFEFGWAVGSLLSVGISATIPDAIVDTLRAALTDDGVGVAPGLLCDADSTAATLFALAQCGDVRRLDALLRFDTGEHFHCWPGERNPSISANAHVLETIADRVVRRPDGAADLIPVRDRVAAWLVDHQRPEGSWLDKWHASPYYATLVCVRALTHIEPHTEIHTASLDRATQWVLDSQRSDGSWGRWDGTAEETAYAIQILLRGRKSPEPEFVAAANRGAEHLTPPVGGDHAQLWHDKDLYAPHRVIDAEILVAHHLLAKQS